VSDIKNIPAEENADVVERIEPTRDFLEVGEESDASYADDMLGVNSADGNKSVEDLFASFKQNEDSLSESVRKEVRQSLTL